MYRTKAEIKMTAFGFDVVIPAKTRCKRITEGATAGRFWVDDLSWLDKRENGLLYHDAYNRGIDIAPELVEES